MKNTKSIQKAIKAFNNKDMETLNKIIADNNREFKDLQNMDFETRERLDFEAVNGCRDMFYFDNDYDDVVEILEDDNIDYEPEDMQEFQTEQLLSYTIY